MGELTLENKLTRTEVEVDLVRRAGTHVARSPPPSACVCECECVSVCMCVCV